MKHPLLTWFGLLLVILCAACSSGPTEDAPATSCEACPDRCLADTCVGCVDSVQCEANYECVNNQCKPETDPCSLCSPAQVCDVDKRECVACLGHGDCSAAEFCDAATGVPACLPDVCKSGSSKCVGTTIAVCSAPGNDYLPPTPCAEGERCVEDASQAWCETISCTPGQAECLGSRVVACDADGSSRQLIEDCAATGGVCVDASPSPACQPRACAAGERRCDGASLQECDSLGTGWEEIQACAFACDPVALECTSQICEPYQTVCQGGAARTCNSGGTGYSSVQQCASDQICQGGACATVTCIPNEYSCDSQTIMRCNATGTSRTSVETCTSGYCVPGESTCQTSLCTPGAVSCDGDRVVTCNSAGSGYVDSTAIDCAAQGQVCRAAKCETQLCTPGRECVGKTLYECAADGFSRRTLDTCAYNETCSVAYGACIKQLCTPGQPACFGERAGTCSTDGVELLPGSQDCTVLGLRCGSGACKPQICDPALFGECVGSTAYRCEAHGTELNFSNTCAYYQYCLNGRCYSDACTANSRSCDGEEVVTCALDGSGWTPTGPDCALSDQVCLGGSCRARVCDPAQPYTCDGERRVVCNYNGSSTTTYTLPCVAPFRCTVGQALCTLDVCTPNAPACDGQRATLCSADGAMFLPGGTQCAASCAGGACVPALFAETFEDGDALGWSQVTGSDVSVLAGSAAPPSSLGLRLSGQLRQVLPAQQPTSVSVWIYGETTGSTDAVEFRLFGSTDGVPNAQVGNLISLTTANGELKVGTKRYTFTPGRWYHVELENMNWTTRTFDLRLDGALVAIALPFEGPKFNFVESVWISSTGYAYFDEIVFN